MGFNYDGAINSVISMQTYRNADGTAKAVMILNGLKHCPFITVVADLLEISIHHLYRLLGYYLGKLILGEILIDIGKRKAIKHLELENKEKENLKSILGL